MKTKYLLATLIILISFTTISTIEAQEPKKKEIKPSNVYHRDDLSKVVENLQKAYKEITMNAVGENHFSKKPCKPLELLSKLDKSKFIPSKQRTRSTLYHLINNHREGAYRLERYYKKNKGLFEFVEDETLNAYSTTDSYEDFVKVFSGENIGDVNDSLYMKSYYSDLKEIFSKKHGVSNFYFKEKNCDITGYQSFKSIKFDYPNVTWELKIELSVNCSCDAEIDLKKIKETSFEYVTTTQGLFTVSEVSFGYPKNSKVYVKSLECCPEEEKESKIALNEANDDDKGYFQVGLYGGIPLGEEKDFYSLNYGGYGAYLFNLGDNFSAGAGVGYTRFTGIDGIDGAGFTSIFGRVEYDFSDKFALRANAGYAISTETDGKGGIYYSAGLGWNITPKISIGPSFSSINLDGGSFNSVAVGITGTF